MITNRLATLAQGLMIAVAVSCVSQPAYTQPQPAPEAAPSYLNTMPPLADAKRGYKRIYTSDLFDPVYGIKNEQQEIKDLLLSYSQTNAEAAWPVYYLAYQLRLFLVNPDLTDGQVATLLAELRTNLAGESRRRAEALATLQNQPAMQTVKLQQFLLLAGESGEEIAVTNALPRALYRLQKLFLSPADDLPTALTNLGVTDEKTRAAILAYATEYESEIEPLLYQLDVITTVARSPKVYASYAGVSPDDEGVRALMQRYEGSVQKFKARQAEKLHVLDREIGYSKSPRLESALLLLGLTDTSIRLVDRTGDANYGLLRRRNPITGDEEIPGKSASEIWSEELYAKNQQLLEKARKR